MEVHRHLGPGLLESVYEHCLCHELSLMGLGFARQKPLPLSYNTPVLRDGIRRLARRGAEDIPDATHASLAGPEAIRAKPDVSNS